MSNTATFDKPVYEEKRIAYRPAVVDLVRRNINPEIQRVNADLTAKQEQVNKLLAQIADGEKYITELRQAVKDIEAKADLPPAPLTPLSLKCRSCDMPVVQLGDGRWTHSGRELVEHGERCDAKNKQSPVAEPAKGPAQAFGDWNNAIKDERAGGHS